MRPLAQTRPALRLARYARTSAARGSVLASKGGIS